MNNHVRDKLRELIAADASLHEDATRCIGLLRDYCPDYQLEVNMLATALRAGVPDKLLGSHATLSIAVLLSQQTEKITNTYGSQTENARWAVETWALALRLISPIDLTPEGITPTVPPPPPPPPTRSASEPAASPPSTHSIPWSSMSASSPKTPVVSKTPRPWLIPTLGVVATLVAISVGIVYFWDSLGISLGIPLGGDSGLSTITVSQGDNTQYTKINDAIRDVKAGGEVLIRPGRYNESVVLDKTLSLIGDGEREDIIIETHDGSCVEMLTKNATVRGLTLRGQSEQYYTVNISQGHLLLEGCNITSTTLGGVAVDNASADIRNCKIYDGKASGVFVSNNGKATIDNCDIFGNGKAGIAISQGGAPIVKGSRVNRNGYYGILVYDSGTVAVSDSDLRGNFYGAQYANTTAGGYVEGSGNME
jgi:hypothetical protein